MNKFLTIFLVLLGIGGAAIGIYAGINPQGAYSIISGVNTDDLGLWLGIGVPIFFILIFGAAFTPFIKMAMKNSQKKQRLKQVGVKGVAKILSVSDTGMTVNENPYVKITVEMNGKQAEFSTMVSRVGVPRPGDSIEVIYDPADPTQVIPA